MSQEAILEFLKEEREKSDRWVPRAEIRKAMIQRGFSQSWANCAVYTQVYKLHSYDLIEGRGEGVWKHQKLFRAKK